MNEETETLPESMEDEYALNPPVQSRRVWMKKLQYVEPVMFLSMLSGGIFSSILTNAIELQYCKAKWGIDNSTACFDNKLPRFSEIQKFTSTFSMTQTVVDTIIPAIGSIFLGPWSDSFGRRPLMLSCTIGYIITCCLWMWGSITNLSPYYFLAFGLPLSLSGGSMIAIVMMFCYVCDITTLDMRAQRLGILQGFLHAGSLAGTVAAPYLLELGYTFIFGFCAVLEVIKAAYILLVLKESVCMNEVPQRSVSKNPFQWSYVRSLYEACYVKQTSRTFTILVYVILLLSISMIQAFGEGSVFYMFVQKVLGWSLSDYTPLKCANIISSAYFAFVGTWFFSKVLKLADLEVMALATGIRLMGSLILAFGRHVWLIYIAGACSSASGLYGAMIRVFLSRVIHSDDLGKVFALLGSFDSVTPLMSSLIYNEVYNKTIDTYPSAIYLLSGVFCFIMTLLIAKITHIHLRPSNELILSPTDSSINYS